MSVTMPAGISRRAAIGLGLGGVLLARAPLAQTPKVLGSLRSQASTDPAAARFTAALSAGLREQGWSEAQNLRIETRWTAGTAELSRIYSSELAALRPDVLLAYSSIGASEMLKVHGSIPMVFAGVQDPIEQGLVTNLAHPGEMITGFTSLVPTLAGRWVELLHEISPDAIRVGMIYNPDTAPQGGAYFRGDFQEAAIRLGLEPLELQIRSVAELQSAVRALAGVERSGLVVMSDTFLINNRWALIAEVASQRLPAVYGNLLFAEAGAMLSYGIDPYEPMRGAGGYVGRILNGTMPGDLPVQAPSVFRLVVNMIEAATIGVRIPVAVLARADQVME